MTVVAIQRVSGDRLHAMADSLVADGGPLLAHTCKLMRLPINVLANASEPSRHEIGFAFAGSTLLENASFGLLSAALSNLCDVDLLRDQSARPPLLPSLDDIAEFATHAFSQMVANMGEIKGKTPSSSICLFGQCPIKQELTAYLIDSQISDGKLYFVERRLPLPHDEKTIIFGDPIACDAVKRNAEMGLFMSIQEAIDDKKIEAVGGHDQVMVIDRDRVHFPLVLDLDDDGSNTDNLIGLNMHKKRVGRLSIGGSVFSHVKEGGTFRYRNS